MSEEVIFICMNLHGALLSTSETNATPIKLAAPNYINVAKFSVTFPGTTGLNFSPECQRAKNLLEAEQFVNAKRMTSELLKTYQQSIPERRKDDMRVRKQSPTYEHIGDTAMCSINGQEFMEPQRGLFYFKSYEIDKDYEKKLFSIEILNGRFVGENILDYNFLLKYYPKVLSAGVDDIFTFSNGLKVLKEINLDELFILLKGIGITNVYIIDPSCSNNMYEDTARGQRRMKRNVIQGMNRQPSGEIIRMEESPSNNVCTNCDTKAGQIAAKTAGVVCCLGTALGLSAPAIVGTTAAAGLGVYNMTKSEKMEKREGGKKNKTKNKKHYKTKTKKHYKTKTKKHYKTKTKPKKHYKTKK